MSTSLSVKYFNKAKSIAQSLVDPYCGCVVSWWTALYLFDSARWDECKEELNNVERTAETIGFTKIHGDAIGVLGILSFLKGDFHQARSYFQKGSQISLKVFFFSSFFFFFFYSEFFSKNS